MSESGNTHDDGGSSSLLGEVGREHDGPLPVANDRIWFAWDGERRGVLGCQALATAVGSEPITAFVMAHARQVTFQEHARSGVVIDAFRFQPRRGFLRPIVIDQAVRALEVLIEVADHGAPAAGGLHRRRVTPLRSFELERLAEPGSVVGRSSLVLLNMTEKDPVRVGCAYFSEVDSNEALREDGPNGWAVRIPYDLVQDDERGRLVRIAPVVQVLPKPRGRIAIRPLEYNLQPAANRPANSGPAIVSKIFEDPRFPGVGFEIEFSGGSEVLAGLRYRHYQRQAELARAWAAFLPDDDAAVDNLLEKYAHAFAAAVANLEEFAGQAAAVPFWADEIRNTFGRRNRRNAWRAITRPGSDTRGTQTLTLNLRYLALGDEIVFYDTRERDIESPGRETAGPVLAFRMGTRRLEPIENPASDADLNEARLDIAREPDRGEESDFSAYHPRFAGWLQTFDAQTGQSPLLPLFAKALEENESAHVGGPLAWETFYEDPAACLIAYTVFGRLEGAPLSPQDDGRIVARALAAAGHPRALVVGETAESQVSAAMLLLQSTSSEAMQLCLRSLDGIDPSEHDLEALAADAQRLHGITEDEQFRRFLSSDRRPEVRELFGPDGVIWPIHVSILDHAVTLMNDLRTTFDEVISGLSSTLGQGDEDPEEHGAMVEATARHALESLLQSDEPEKQAIAQRYQALLESASYNGFACHLVIAEISARFPGYVPDRNRDLREMRTRIERWSGTGEIAYSEDVVTILSRDVGFDRDSLELCTKLSGVIEQAVETMRKRQELDDNQVQTIQTIAPACATALVRNVLQNAVTHAEQSGLALPHSLSKRLAVWPRDAQSTLAAFVNSQESDSLAPEIVERIERDLQLPAIPLPD